jgi:hypothetical protein
MRKRILSVVCVLFLLSVTVLAENPPEPGVGGQNTPTCSTCDVNLLAEGECHPNAPNGTWADCQGGLVCYYDPLSGSYCEPYCGRERCYYV